MRAACSEASLARVCTSRWKRSTCLGSTSCGGSTRMARRWSNSLWSASTRKPRERPMMARTRYLPAMTSPGLIASDRMRGGQGSGRGGAPSEGIVPRGSRRGEGPARRGASGDERAAANLLRQGGEVEGGGLAHGDGQDPELLGLRQRAARAEREDGEDGPQGGERALAGEQPVIAHVPDLVDQHLGHPLLQRIADLGRAAEDAA